MGSWFSKPQPSGVGPDPRPQLVYSSLQFLDIILIRSRVNVNGLGIDSRIASTIRFGSLGLQIPEETFLSKYDRVGLIQLPSFIEKFEYSPDNIEVTEATYYGIQTRTLRQVLDSSLEVSIRSLKLGSQIQREEEKERKKKEAAQALRNGAAPAAASSSSTEEVKDGSEGAEDELSEEMQADENNERLEFLQKYYQFTGPVVNRPFGQCMDKLESMFRFVMSSLKKYELPQAEIEKMSELLEKYMEGFTGGDGKPQRGIPFHSLLPLFRELSVPQVADSAISPDEAAASFLKVHPNTFSDAEIFELVSSFTMGDDRVSLWNTGFIAKNEFLTQWKASLERTLPLRRIPREILSGAFVSQAYQQIGVLPQSEDAYYLPMDFAMMEPPVEGWSHAEDTRTPAQIFQEKQAREEARKKEEQNRAHLPKLTGHGSSAGLTHAEAAKLTSNNNPDAGDFHLVGAGSSHMVLEGEAVQRIHSHAVARLGVEQQVPYIPPPVVKEKDDY